MREPWFIFTKNGIQYSVTPRITIATDLVNGTVEYCYHHHLARFMV
jgi:hypothetical protein